MVQRNLVKQLSLFTSLEENIFSVYDMDHRFVMQTEPYMKIGPYNSDFFALIVSDSDNSDEMSCQLCTAPLDFNQISKYIPNIFDFLSDPSFSFNKHSGVGIRFMHPDLSFELDYLALALLLNDANLFSFNNKNNRKTGLDNWVSYTLKEQLLIELCQNKKFYNTLFNSNRSQSAIQSSMQEFLMNDFTCFTHCHPGTQFIDFNHFYGENYNADTVDFFEVISDINRTMAKVVNNYDYKAYKTEEYKKALSELHLDLNNLFQNLNKIVLSKKDASEDKIFSVSLEGKHLGYIHLMNSTFDNCLISVDDKMDFCVNYTEALPKILLLNSI
jgi:hypothetical protein